MPKNILILSDGTGQAGGLPLVEIRPPADVTVRKREHRLTPGEDIQVRFVLAQAPRLNRERGSADHLTFRTDGRVTDCARPLASSHAP